MKLKIIELKELFYKKGTMITITYISKKYVGLNYDAKKQPKRLHNTIIIPRFDEQIKHFL